MPQSPELCSCQLCSACSTPAGLCSPFSMRPPLCLLHLIVHLLIMTKLSHLGGSLTASIHPTAAAGFCWGSCSTFPFPSNEEKGSSSQKKAEKVFPCLYRRHSHLSDPETSCKHLENPYHSPESEQQERSEEVESRVCKSEPKLSGFNLLLRKRREDYPVRTRAACKRKPGPALW